MKKYLVIFEPTETGFSCYVPDLQGCVSTGSNKEDAEKNIYEAILFHLEGLREEGMAIPINKSESEILLFA